jgi:ankyrin repeat protein
MVLQAALMGAGARLNLPPTEEAALLSSVLHMKRHDQLLALLAAGANPAAADYDSRTPLHIAASVGECACVSQDHGMWALVVC